MGGGGEGGRLHSPDQYNRILYGRGGGGRGGGVGVDFTPLTYLWCHKPWNNMEH